MYIFIAWIIIRLIIAICDGINWKIPKIKFPGKRIEYVNGLFINGFIDSKVFYVTRFNALANISLIKQIDTSKAYAFIMENFGTEITSIYQYNTFDHDESRALFNVTIFVLKDKRMIELGFDYAEILYTGKHYGWANALLNDLANCRVGRTKVIGFMKSETLN